MVAQLREAGITAKIGPQSYPNGAIRATTIPRGNPTELWEPEASSGTVE